LNTLSSLCDIRAMFAMYDNRAVDSLIVDDNFNEERSCRNNSELQASMILFNIATLIATNVKIIFVESNDKDAYCVHRSSKDVDVFMNIDAFMNMSQLKVTQIWNMRLNEYSKYWSLKALKSVTVTLYKLQMLLSNNLHVLFYDFLSNDLHVSLHDFLSKDNAKR